MKYFIGVLLTAALVTPARAQEPVNATAPATYGAWRSSQIGGGGFIQNVVACPTNPNRYYAYVDVGGLYRSDDGGQRWKMLHGNLPARPGVYEVRGLIVDPRDDRRLIAALGSQWDAPLGIFTSADAGASWTQTLTAPFFGNGSHRWSGVLLARQPQNPDVILAASVRGGLFRSDDNGATWRSLSAATQNLYPSEVRFDRAAPNRIWLAAQDYDDWVGGEKAAYKAAFLRSDDGGQSWEKLAAFAPTELLQDPTQDGVLYGIFDSRIIRVSSDGGRSWRDFSDGLPVKPLDEDIQRPGPHEFNALAAGPDFVLTATTEGDFYRLDAGSTSWRKIERQNVQMNYEGAPWYQRRDAFGDALASITVDPRDPAHWFFTDWFAIYQTHDAGRNWQLTMDGVEVTVLHALAQDPTDPGVVHLGMADNGYFLSENGGARFHLAEGISNNVKSIALSPKLPARLYATGPVRWDWAAQQVFVSIDRGQHWTRSPMTGLPDMETHHCNSIAVDADDPYTAYLGVSGEVKPNGGGVYQSSDGGKTWRWMGDGLPAGEAFFNHDIWVIGPEIAVGQDGVLVAVSRPRGEVYRFDAAAKTWQRAELKLNGPPNAVVAQGDRFYVAVENDGVYASADNGQNWNRVYEGSVRHVAVDGAHPNRIAAGASGGIVLSDDDGASWHPAPLGLPFRVYPIPQFAGERLLAGTTGNGAFWTPLIPVAAADIAAAPAVPVPVAGAMQAPALQNGDMTLGEETVENWANAWYAEGTLLARRDTTHFKSTPASLLVTNDGGAAYGSVAQRFQPVGGEFQASGAAKVGGNPEEALVAIQSFDENDRQIGWQTLLDVKDVRDWSDFSAPVSLPAGAAYANLVITFKGEGKVWVDDLKFEATPGVWKE